MMSALMHIANLISFKRLQINDYKLHWQVKVECPYKFSEQQVTQNCLFLPSFSFSQISANFHYTD